ncbi:MAG: hypothetical protein KBT46_02715 [Ruminococcus sp.]|nr:hypothetical protein [Candidatus Copronaster equi]
MRNNKCTGNKIGLYLAAFGLGLIISIIFPNKFVIGVLAFAIVILGLIVGK